ncbi:MAG: PA-phosphatase, partial [Gemmatimonadota bacterium]|nr:PA-phosphatase [Gemmatimonadota bacterium]
MRLSRLRTALPVAFSCAAVFLAAGCDNSIHPTEVLPPLDAASLDANAGTWRMIVLTAPTQFPVAAPAAVSSPAYLAEVDAIKTAQS